VNVNERLKNLSPEAMEGLNEMLLEQQEDWIEEHGQESFDVRKDALVALWIVQAFDFYTDEMLEGLRAEVEDEDGLHSKDPLDYPGDLTSWPAEWPDSNTGPGKEVR
jgi:hypothetical protein